MSGNQAERVEAGAVDGRRGGWLQDHAPLHAQEDRFVMPDQCPFQERIPDSPPPREAAGKCLA